MASVSTQIKLVTAAAVALLAYGATANAQSDLATKMQAKIVAGVKKLESGCGADIQKFCSAITPGEGRLFYCILANEDKISAKCDFALFDASRNLERALDRVEDAADACWTDIEKSCANVPEGGGRIVQCLMSKKDSLSTGCRAAVTKIQDIK